ncbi:surface antigen BspA-like [Trichomonas vaginalis G3]|uniref:Surface antigen BspA-like n=1 Tax=Trichomonas vaginalis (strain ATCC PRA-98 / G3) TaxID=412133 RepID=A2FZU0_TRIV3|nr:regulation of response to stimulus [Trichomonas vaginalis G3]EAX89581.1 surface antigen BspA-like [Trichomonas vaginalis G3]KAI5496097.1 regulation of response to stimulus [Trichomonas vaginalis G3]|eukprot:XP_001302511.1 surface antigen BspA-like [Trichomonas vaginalis G3]
MSELDSKDYSTDGLTLLSVSSKSPNIIISSKCVTIFGSTDDNYAFRIAKDLVETFTFQNNPNLRYINSYAFYSCTKLRSVDLSMCSKLETLGSYSFSKCSSVTTFILPEGLKSIGYCAISELRITTINIPSTVTYISDNGICNMGSLKSVTFSKGSQLTTLLSNTFINTGLTSFTFPEKLSMVPGLTFSGVGSINEIHLDTANKNFFCDDKALYSYDRTVIYYFASNIGGSYKILESVTKISLGCFCFTHLKSLIIPQSVTEIEGYAFYYSSISNITLPRITTIGECTFIGSSISTIYIPDSVVEIGTSAFEGCSKLKILNLPSSIKTIGGNALPNYDDVQISFSDNPNLYLDKQYVLFTDQNTTISQFLGTKTEITLPGTVKIIKEKAFNENKKIGIVSFEGGSNIEKVESSAFQGCTNLSRFDFGTKIIEIQNSAFENTILNSEISFPETITKIGDSAFKNCKFIPSIRFESLSSTRELKSFYNKRSYELYKQLYSSSPLTIGNDAFSSCSSISEIAIYRDTSISFGQNTFSGLLSLTRFTFYNNIISIGSGCFMNSGLRHVEFRDNIICNNILPAFIFSGCTNLTDFDIPTNCETIDSSSLSGTSIIHLSLPDRVRTLGDQCLKDCRELVSVDISNSSSLERIGYGVFDGCTKFSVVSPFSSTHFVFDSGAIYSSDKHHMHVYPPASSRSYFYLLDGVEVIEDSAFIGCIHLVSVLLPEVSLVRIGSSSFKDCINLRHITIPSSIVSIGSDAFRNCPLLVCGALIQNKSNKTLVSLLSSSGLELGSTSFCNGFSCTVHPQSTINIPISNIAVFILL